MKGVPVTGVETFDYTKQAKAIFSAREAASLATFIAYNPTAGVVMRGTGGVRKLRWARTGKGKRGGARVIYYYHSQSMPVFMFGVYVKSAKPDLTGKQRNALKRIVADIVKSYGMRS